MDTLAIVVVCEKLISKLKILPPLLLKIIGEIIAQQYHMHVVLLLHCNVGLSILK